MSPLPCVLQAGRAPLSRSVVRSLTTDFYISLPSRRAPTMRHLAFRSVQSIRKHDSIHVQSQRRSFRSTAPTPAETDDTARSTPIEGTSKTGTAPDASKPASADDKSKIVPAGTMGKSGPARDTSKSTTTEPVPGSLASLSRAIGLDSLSRGGSGRTLEELTGSYRAPGEHHLYIYAHKHNTHITLTGPRFLDSNTNRMRQEVLLSLSCGNIGYRKSQRGTYDAAFQLASYVMNRVHNDGLLMKIHRLELVLRGFGAGREGCIKVVLGQEGAAIRDRIVRVVDTTRVKMGGQRAPRPRRL